MFEIKYGRLISFSVNNFFYMWWQIIQCIGGVRAPGVLVMAGYPVY